MIKSKIKVINVEYGKGKTGLINAQIKTKYGEKQGFDPLISTDHFSFFDITAEWLNTTQIATILSSDGTYNVYMHLGFSSNEPLTFSTYSRENINI